MEPTPADRPDAPAPAARRALGWILVLGAAAAMRLFIWAEVYTPQGVRLTGDGDALYHVLRSARMVEGSPGAPWRDPGLNYPAGADIPWPPLFDGMLAAAGWLAAGLEAPSLTDIANGGSVVPVLLALATLPIVAILARLLVGEGGLEAALVLSLMPAHATFSMLGRTDQHVLETLIFASLLVPVARAVREPETARGWTSLALGALFAIAFWNWIGSALYPLLLVAFTAAWFVSAPSDDHGSRRLASDLASGAALGAALLAGSIALVRGPAMLAQLRLSGLSGLQPLLLLLTSAFGAGLLAASRVAVAAGTPARRAVTVVAAAAGPAAAATLLPGAWGEVSRGLAALGRSNAWYASINEFEPLLGGGWTSLREDVVHLVSMFGLTFAAVPFAAATLVARLRDPRERPPAALLLGLGAALLSLTLARQRFGIYLAPLLAVLVATAWRRAAVAVGDRLGASRFARTGAFMAVGAMLLGPALWFVGLTVRGEASGVAEMRRVLERVGRLPVAPDRPSIVAEWSDGHLVQYVTGRPVLASPFGVEGGEGAMEESAAFFLATREVSAERVLDRHLVGLVALGDPTAEMVFAAGFAPPGEPRLSETRRSVWGGGQNTLSPLAREAIPWRLFFDDGGPSPRSLSSFRLLDEARFVGGTVPYKVFGVVPGARLEIAGVRPGEVVVASTEVVSPRGRRFEWATSGAARMDGRVELRVPYATGRNGASLAEPYAIRGTEASLLVEVSEADVLFGRSVTRILERGARR